MLKMLSVAFRLAAVTLAITGIGYPLLTAGLAQLIFPYQANGSLILDERGQIAGSALIGQSFRHPAYLQPRPSAAGASGYDPLASGGSNLGPSSRILRERMTAELLRLQAENSDAPGPVPPELITASASGLDPHLSPSAALWQAPRIARARQVDPERVRQVVLDYIVNREFRILGEPSINVLQLNLALDRQFGKPQ